MLKFAGFPLSAWAFALRTWAAMMLALYVAFWLQLESASSAAVTVGILSLQTRGQAYQKAIYRILATVIGVVASLVLAGLFPQSRVLFVIGYAGWLGLCVYVGGIFEGNRAYGVVLSGYTVAIVAVTQIELAAEYFLDWRRPRRGDRGWHYGTRPGQRPVPCPEPPYDPFRQGRRGASAGACLRNRYPPGRKCGPSPVSESAARDHRSSSGHLGARH